VFACVFVPPPFIFRLEHVHRFFFSCQRIQLRKHDATVEDLRKEIARLTEENKRLENENKMLNERVTRAENKQWYGILI